MSVVISCPGINIQYPWSRLILDGSKAVETRGYPLPQQYVGKWLCLIETPGRLRGKGMQAAIQGLVKFRGSFRYTSEAVWLRDFKLHRVAATDPEYYFDQARPKWAWEISDIVRFEVSLPPPQRRGIVFTKEIAIPSRLMPFDSHL